MSSQSPGHLYDLFGEILSRLPVPAAGKLKTTLAELKETVIAARAPRLELLAPADSGVPPALAALVGEASPGAPDAVLFLCLPGTPMESMPHGVPVVGVMVDPAGGESPDQWGDALSAAVGEQVRVFACGDQLVEYLLERLPACTHLHLARACGVKGVQRTVAMRLVGLAADMAGMIAATPIPVDLPLMTSVQIGMVTGVAYVGGNKLDRAGAVEFLTALGAGAVAGAGLREAARALVKVVFPVAGGLVTAGVAHWGTMVLGQAAVGYFVDGQGLERVREVVERAAPGRMGGA